MTAIPTLQTQRLILRPYRLEDFEPFAAMWADPQVVRHIGGKPFTRQESWAKFLQRVGHWPLFGFGSWVIEDKNARFIGEIGFGLYKRDMEPQHDMPELGYVLTTHAHGKGYASEAGREVLEWADSHLDHPVTACLIDDDNLASQRVAEKLGYRKAYRATYKDKPVILFTRARQRP